jgi:hypothetical protein
MATPIGSQPSAEDLIIRANEVQSVLPETNQGDKTAAAGYTTDANGNGYVIVASSDTNLSPAQRDALDLNNGELSASGKGLHAETTVLKYANDNGVTLSSCQSACLWQLSDCPG